MSFSRLLLLVVLLTSGADTVSMAQEVKKDEPDAVHVTLLTGDVGTVSVPQEAKRDQPDAVNVTLISALVGLISGLSASLIAPLINWQIERRRYGLDYRRDIIANARGNAQPGFISKTFLGTHSFFQLKDELSKPLVTRLQNDREANLPDIQERIRIDLLEEIAQIEKKWFL